MSETPAAVPGLALTEVFTTLQGEGPAAGQLATFVRFGGCNLSCSWCDSPFTWDAQRFDMRAEIGRRDVEDVLAEVTAPIAVITGGEPLLHQRSPAFRNFLAGLAVRGIKIHLETNGTVAPSALLQQVTDLAVVSPKLDHAQADARSGTKPVNLEVLKQFAALAVEGRAILKVVVQTAEDCARAVELGVAAGFPYGSIWLMPEGTTLAELAPRWRMVCDFAIATGVSATHRLHVLAWGEERGH